MLDRVAASLINSKVPATTKRVLIHSANSENQVSKEPLLRAFLALQDGLTNLQWFPTDTTDMAFNCLQILNSFG